MRRRYGPSPAMKPVASSAVEPLTARGARVAARIPAHPARTPDATAEPGGYAACLSYVSPRRLGAAAEGRACHDDGRGTRHPCRLRERLSASV